jgi:hypothetical protein
MKVELPEDDQVKPPKGLDFPSGVTAGLPFIFQICRENNVLKMEWIMKRSWILSLGIFLSLCFVTAWAGSLKWRLLIKAYAEKQPVPSFPNRS